jgi:hypothetical protein
VRVFSGHKCSVGASLQSKPVSVAANFSGSEFQWQRISVGASFQWERVFSGSECSVGANFPWEPVFSGCESSVSASFSESQSSMGASFQ